MMSCLLDQLNAEIFITNGFETTDFVQEPEGQEYAASQFKLSDKCIIYREAKITPKKVGQFVTCWKRNNKGITTPLDSTDNIDFYLIVVSTDNQLGVFVLPRAILIEKGIMSTLKKDGKRGFRVYPSWDKPQSKQAIKTQAWQLNYFCEIIDKHTKGCLKNIFQ